MKKKYRVQRQEAGKWLTLAMVDYPVETDSQAKAVVEAFKLQDIETNFRAQVKTAFGWITVAE